MYNDNVKHAPAQKFNPSILEGPKPKPELGRTFFLRVHISRHLKTVSNYKSRIGKLCSEEYGEG